jgi:hypothetical protein
MNELAIERQLADQLADALINGGMDRQFQAIAFHEHTRNGFMYPGVKVGNSPESNRRSVASVHRTIQVHRYKWARPDHKNKDFWIQFQQEQDKPYNQDEENE